MGKTIINIKDDSRESLIVNEVTDNVEIFVGENATLDYYILESQNHLKVHQAEGSNVAIGCFSLCGSAKHNIRIDLEGEGTSTKLFGVVIADGQQEIENTTYIDHKVKGCQSDEIFKYILNDEAKAAFFGRIHVAHGAIKTDAHQTVRTLCLTDKTRMQAKPELEIYADDVKCSHGATVGQLDQNALLYMRTRGIPETEARRLLMVAFVDDVLANVKDENLHEELSRLIEQRLN